MEVQNKLETGLLYRTELNFSVIDAVSTLNQQPGGKTFLLFFQVSIKKYEDHHPLSELFFRIPNLKLKNKAGVWTSNMSIFTHYKNLFQCKDVLLVYVSPREEGRATTLAAKLLGEMNQRRVLSEATNDFNIECARIVDNSDFHQEVKVNKSFEAYFQS